ncbi:hypothetical protein BpHYR1_016841 [Brachionus plicatilis]|uniref:Uncharacterized protein n=1 Tax=Brachionus plicatilis TaxID=10195 RepID=A0A3M7PGD3_BRAPC|nr:hypothetical protein BpHYR1_016841 [Brachionus plicatilis]
MIFFMVPISKDYLEKLSVQELVHLIKTQNGSFENEFQKLDDDSELVSCTEAKQMEWLQNTDFAETSSILFFNKARAFSTASILRSSFDRLVSFNSATISVSITVPQTFGFGTSPSPFPKFFSGWTSTSKLVIHPTSSSFTL